jgi:hypothetical protein
VTSIRRPAFISAAALLLWGIRAVTTLTAMTLSVAATSARRGFIRFSAITLFIDSSA